MAMKPCRQQAKPVPADFMLHALCASITLLALGCGWGQSAEEEVRNVVLSLRLTKRTGQEVATGRGRIQIANLIDEHGEGLLLQSLRTLYHECSDPKDKIRLAIASEQLAARTESSDSKRWLRELATNMFEEEAPDLVARGLHLLDGLTKGSMAERVTERLETTRHPRVRGQLLGWLASHGIFEAIKDELALPRPEEDDKGSLPAWRSRIRLALAVCENAAFGRDPLPASVIGKMVGPVVADPHMVYLVVHTVLNTGRPEDAKGALLRAQSSLGAGSRARIWVDAALMAVEAAEEKDRRIHVEALEDAAASYRKGEECWREVRTRTASLSLAAAYRRDRNLLGAIWDACQNLKMRDRAELLWLMSRECSRRGTNEFLLFLEAIPVDELERMAGLVYGRLTAQIDCLVIAAEHRPLPESVSKEEMRGAVQRISRVLLRTTEADYHEARSSGDTHQWH